MSWLKQSTAVTLLIGPFVDDGDGKSAETSLTISQGDVRLSKNGGNMAQKNESTACTHDEIGYYTCPLDTTDTNTLGILKVMVHESGALPVWNEYMVVPANVWDSMFGADMLKVDVHAIDDDETAADNAEAFFDGTGYAGTNNVIPTTTAVTNGVTLANDAITSAKFDESTAFPLKSADTGATAVARTGADSDTLETLSDELVVIDGIVDAIKAKTDSLTFTVAGDVDCNVQTWKGSAAADMTGDAYARLGAPAGASVSADVAAVKTQTAAIEVDTQDLQTQVGADGAGLTALPWNAAWDAEVQSECTDALNAYDPPTAAEMTSAFTEIKGATWAATDTLEAIHDDLAVVDGIVDDILVDTGTTLDGIVDDILADTNELQGDWANGGRLDLILDSAASAGDPWSTELPGAYGAGTAGLMLGTTLPGKVDTIDGIVDDILVDTATIGAPAGASVSADIAAIKAETAAIVEDTGTTLPATLATIDGIVDDILVDTAVIGALGAGLTNIPWNAAWDAEVQSECTDALNAYDPPTKAELDSGLDAVPTATENADALLNRDMSAVSDTTARSPLNALRALRNKASISAGTLTVCKEDDATSAWTATVTTDADAEPITVVDPA